MKELHEQKWRDMDFNSKNYYVNLSEQYARNDFRDLTTDEHNRFTKTALKEFRAALIKLKKLGAETYGFISVEKLSFFQEFTCGRIIFLSSSL